MGKILINQFDDNSNMGKLKKIIDDMFQEIVLRTILTETLIEYNQLLTDECSDLVGVAAVHGWKSKRYEKGKEYREIIEKALKSLEKYNPVSKG